VYRKTCCDISTEFRNFFRKKVLSPAIEDTALFYLYLTLTANCFEVIFKNFEKGPDIQAAGQEQSEEKEISKM